MTTFRIVQAISVSLTLLISSAAYGGDFGKAPWGTNTKQIRKLEFLTKLLGFTKNSLTFQREVAGMPARVVYDFRKDKLVRGSYIFDPKRKTDQLDKEIDSKYLEDWTTIKQGLVQKYGKPLKDLEIWTKTSYKKKRHEWGAAVRLGHLSYFATWETKDTNIVFALYGEKFKTTMAISYENKAFKIAYNKQQKKRAIAKKKLEKANKRARQKASINML